MGSNEQPGNDPRIGQVLHGRYRVIGKLGEGGMGAVYEAQHVLIGRKLAIKTLHPQFAGSPELVERFHREANAAASIGNEHIIEVTDFGFFDDDGAPYLVMEYLKGRELSDLLDSEGALPLSRLMHIMLQVCDALAAAHSRGIVHRDIKPENIFLIRRGADPDFVKVLDFGISKMSQSDEQLQGSLTRTGVALGTPYYMPPEQAQGIRDIDQRADVYALGVILYRALAGRLPFDAETYAALMVKILTEAPPLPHSFRADIPRELEDVALKAMAKNRDERFASVQELALALLPFSEIDGAPQMLRSVQPPMVVDTTPFTSSDVETPSKPEPVISDPIPLAQTPVTVSPADLGVAKLAVFGGGALAALGVGALVVVLLSRGEERSPEPPTPPATPHAATVVQTPSDNESAQRADDGPARAPGEVRVRISASPKAARIFLDDVEFPNPMDAFRPRSLDPLRIRVDAEGHQSVEQLAIFDQDRELTFALEPGSGKRRLEDDGRASARKEAAQKEATQKETKRVERKPVDQGQADVVPTKHVTTPTQDNTPGTSTVDDGLYRGPTGDIRKEF